MAYDQELGGAYLTGGSGTLVTGPCSLDSIGVLCVTAGTVIFRDGGALGPIVWVLGAAANISASHTFQSCRRIKKSLYAVCSQTDGTVVCAIKLPTANQADPS